MDVNKTLENIHVLGVCSWLAVRLNADVKVIRIIFIVATLIGFGTPALLYLILFFLKEFILRN